MNTIRIPREISAYLLEQALTTGKTKMEILLEIMKVDIGVNFWGKAPKLEKTQIRVTPEIFQMIDNEAKIQGIGRAHLIHLKFQTYGKEKKS
jgi:predicted DNA-binding protein